MHCPSARGAACRPRYVPSVDIVPNSDVRIESGLAFEHTNTSTRIKDSNPFKSMYSNEFEMNTSWVVVLVLCLNDYDSAVKL